MEIKSTLIVINDYYLILLKIPPVICFTVFCYFNYFSSWKLHLISNLLMVGIKVFLK